MAIILRQSTAVDVLIGPFVDSSDGYTSEEGHSPTVLLSKNGQALAAKNDATVPVADDAGCYNCELDATDTNTVGALVLIVEGNSTHLPARHEFQVVEEAVYDLYYASGAGGPMQGSMTALSQGKPTANATFDEILGRLHWQWTYAKTETDTSAGTGDQQRVYADDGSTVLWEYDITDGSDISTRSEAITGA